MIHHQWTAAGEELSRLLVLENETLAVLDLTGAVTLLESKAVLVARFENLAPEPSQHWAAAELLARLSLLAQENRRLLDRAIKAQKRLIGVLAGVVRQTPIAPRYGAHGALRGERSPRAVTFSGQA